MSAQASAEVRTYGGWRTPRSAGIGEMSMGETMLMLSGLVMVIGIQQTAGIVLVLLGILLWSDGLTSLVRFLS